MTPPGPTRDTPAGRAYLDLRTLARRHGRDPAEYLTLYALEGLLARLARSPHATDFVLKGGVLMAAFTARRPTRDIDLAARQITNDVQDVVARIRTIATIDTGDGLTFDTESVSGTTIRDDADYAGVRVKLTAHLATAQIALHVDVNVGDPIWPAPVDTALPLLLGGTLHLSTYPDHMVLAEKIVTAIDRGTVNTRWRDFVDIDAITTTRTIRQADLAAAIDTVAHHRKVTLQPLATALDGMADLAQPKWATWRRKQHLETTTPQQFSDLLNRCVAFADPILHGHVRDATWSPQMRIWTKKS